MQNINVSTTKAKAIAFDCMSDAANYYKNNYEAIHASFLAIDNYLAMLIDECKKTKDAVVKEANNYCTHETASMISETEINNVFSETTQMS